MACSRKGPGSALCPPKALLPARPVSTEGTCLAPCDLPGWLVGGLSCYGDAAPLHSPAPAPPVGALASLGISKTMCPHGALGTLGRGTPLGSRRHPGAVLLLGPVCRICRLARRGGPGSGVQYLTLMTGGTSPPPPRLAVHHRSSCS